MPRVDNTPEMLKPFTFHGLDFTIPRGNTEATAQCPFCERDGKFSVNTETGQWECKVCMTKGNIHTFLRKLYDESRKIACDYDTLAKDRKILNAKSLEAWGLCKSIISGEWLLPGYGVSSKTGKPAFKQLYVWRKDVVEKRMRWICKGFQHNDDTVKTTHGFFMSKWDSKKHGVMLAEAIWDAIALSEVLPKVDEWNQYNVIATPSCNVFQENWLPLFKNKGVTILFDNDHSRPHPTTGTLIIGAGIQGTQKISGLLSEAESVSYLCWGDEGFDASLPSGYDVRDHLAQGETIQERAVHLAELLEKVTPVPKEWGKEAKRVLPECKGWKELLEAWKEAMFWNDGLDNALPVILACAASVLLPEDQLWIKLVSPASTGKTELAEALGMADDLVKVVSIFTGLHSGVRLENGEDGSLINKLGGKTLVIKEGDTLLKLPNREQVLSELRDAYDRNTSTHFKNGVSRNYSNHSFSMIICGTQALHALDDADLGQRYLDVVIMEGINNSQEKMINNKKLGGMRDTLKKNPVITDKTGSSNEAKMRARQLTGGYLQHLHKSMSTLISDIDASDDSMAICSDYAQFVAYFRARPSKSQNEEVTRELSPRLATQLFKLAYCLAAVLGKKTLDTEVLTRVRKVALDTGRGRTLVIANHLYAAGSDGLDTQQIGGLILEGDTETRELLRFLRRIEVVETFRKEGHNSIGTSVKWRLTENLMTLYKRVMEIK